MFGLTAFHVLLFAHTATAVPGPSKTAMAAQYAGLSAAFIRKDVIGAAKYMRADYVYTLLDGTVLRREEYLRRVLNGIQPLTRPKAWTVIDEIMKDPAGIMVSEHRFLTGTQMLDDHKPHAIKRISKVSDLWVEDGRAWRLKRSKVGASTSFVDGKPGAARPGLNMGRVIQPAR